MLLACSSSSSRCAIYTGWAQRLIPKSLDLFSRYSTNCKIGFWLRIPPNVSGACYNDREYILLFVVRYFLYLSLLWVPYGASLGKNHSQQWASVWDLDHSLFDMVELTREVRYGYLLGNFLMECADRNVCSWLFWVLDLFHCGCLVTSRIGDNDLDTTVELKIGIQENLDVYELWRKVENLQLKPEWPIDTPTMDILSMNIAWWHLAHFIDRKDSWVINCRILRIVLTWILLSKLLRCSSLLDFPTL